MDGESHILFCTAMTDFKSHFGCTTELSLVSITLHYRKSKLGLKMVWHSRTSVPSLGCGLHVDHYFNICHVTFKVAQLA